MSHDILPKNVLQYLISKIKDKVPTKTSDLTNDSGYITESSAGDQTDGLTRAEVDALF